MAASATSTGSADNGKTPSIARDDQNVSLTQAHQAAVLSLERIQALDLRPIPQLYELWYRYFQGDPEIVRAVETCPAPLI